MVTRDEVLSILRDVIDPEIGANVVDLGFIRDVHSSCGPLTHPE